MSTESRIIGDTNACPEPPADGQDRAETDKTPPVEIGGRDGPDPTRYGDWEKGGRCIDF